MSTVFRSGFGETFQLRSYVDSSSRSSGSGESSSDEEVESISVEEAVAEAVEEEEKEDPIDARWRRLGEHVEAMQRRRQHIVQRLQMLEPPPRNNDALASRVDQAWQQLTALRQCAPLSAAWCDEAPPWVRLALTAHLDPRRLWALVLSGAAVLRAGVCGAHYALTLSRPGSRRPLCAVQLHRDVLRARPRDDQNQATAMQQEAASHEDSQDDGGDPFDAWDSAFGRPGQACGDDSGADDESSAVEEIEVEQPEEEEDEEEEGDTCSSHSSDDEDAMRIERHGAAPYADEETLARDAQLQHRLGVLERRREAFAVACRRVQQLMEQQPVDTRAYKHKLRDHSGLAGALIHVKEDFDLRRDEALQQLRRAMRDDQTHLQVPDEVRRAAHQQARQIADQRVLCALTAHLDGHQLWAMQQRRQVQFWTLETQHHWVLVAEPEEPALGGNAFLFYIMMARDALRL